MSLLEAPPIFTDKGNGILVMEIDNRYFNVSEEVQLVMGILASSSSYKDAVAQYNKATQEVYSEEDFKMYSEEMMKTFQLDKKQKSFLLIEKIILPPKTAGKLASAIEWMFQPLFFWIAFSGLALLSVYIVFFQKDDVHQHGSFEIAVIPFMLWYSVTILFHEMGHIAACKKFTGKNGGMGVGIYLVYPVFFSNISSIWHANKEQKIITNLAGVYMQLWFVLLFFILGESTHEHFYKDFSKVLVILCFIQLLPFIRSDGYWLLSDIFNVPNLLAKSQRKVSEFLKNPIRFFKTNSGSDYGLFAYGAMNTIFVIMFAYYQLRYNLHALFTFPMYIWSLVQQVFRGEWKSLEFDMQYVTVLVFYYIVYAYGKMAFKSLFGKKKEEVSVI